MIKENTVYSSAWTFSFSRSINTIKHLKTRGRSKKKSTKEKKDILFFKAVLLYEGRREVCETVQGWDTNKGGRSRVGNDDGDIILGAFEDSALMCEVDLHTHTLVKLLLFHQNYGCYSVIITPSSTENLLGGKTLSPHSSYTPKNRVRESAVWRPYVGKISNPNPPCKLSPLLGIPADRRRHLLHLNAMVSTQHTPSVGPAPVSAPLAKLKRNFGSFCNNFWNLHAFLNSHTHLSQSLLWRGWWIKLSGKENEIFTFCVWAGLVVYSWLSASTSLFTRIWLSDTLESTLRLVSET